MANDTEPTPNVSASAQEPASAPVARPNPAALNVMKHSEAPIARPNIMAINEMRNSLPDGEAK